MPLLNTNNDDLSIEIEDKDLPPLQTHSLPRFNLARFTLRLLAGIGVLGLFYLLLSRLWVRTKEQASLNISDNKVSLENEPTSLLTPSAKQLMDYPAADDFISLETLSALNQRNGESLDIGYRKPTFQQKMPRKVQSISDTLQSSYSRAYRPVGAEFPIGTSSGIPSSLPFAALTDDSLVIFAGNYGQRFRANGTTIGSRFQIDSTSGISSLAALSNGDYIICWADRDKGIYAQRYNSDGVKVNSEFRVNNQEAAIADSCKVTRLGVGGFAFAYIYNSIYQNLRNFSLYTQQYTANGTPIGTECQIVAPISLIERPVLPAIALLNSREYVITWGMDRLYGTATISRIYGLYAQRLAMNGTKLGNTFQINTKQVANGSQNKIVGLNDGGFIVTWFPYARRYNAHGLATGPEFLVAPISQDYLPFAVTTLPVGDVVYAWAKTKSTRDADIFVQGYDITDMPVGPVFQVNALEDCYTPELTGLSDGSFIIAWMNRDMYRNLTIFARRYEINTAPRLINNRLSINQGQALALDYADIGAIDQEGDLLTFNVSAIKQGQFRLFNSSGIPIIQFTQEQINKTQVWFVHDGGKLAPFYQVSVSDGQLTTGPSTAIIQFSLKPSPTPTLDPSQAPDSHQALIIGVSVGAAGLASVLGLIAVIGGVCYYHYRKSHKRLSMEYQERLIDAEEYQPDEAQRYYGSINEPFSLIAFNELKITKRLGGGTFGTVYQGQWRHADVAIKRLKGFSLAEDDIENFKKEATLMSKLRHPHVIHLYGVCIEPDNYCLVMENMPEGSLAKRLESNQALTWSERYTLALDIAKGIHQLHSEGIKHRDLKTDNVLLYHLNNELRAKVCDFGLSLARNESSANIGIAGTIGWIAPEILEGKKYTNEADVYSYGMIIRALVSTEISTTEEILAFFTDLIERCCATEPQDRSTMEAIIETLEAHQEDIKQIAPKTTSIAVALQVWGTFRHTGSQQINLQPDKQQESQLILLEDNAQEVEEKRSFARDFV